MLVLSRKVGERIIIGDNVTVVINRIHGNRVSIGVDAPHDVKIIRGELQPFVEEFDEPEHEETRVQPPVIAHAACDFDETPTPFSPRAAR